MGGSSRTAKAVAWANMLGDHLRLFTVQLWSSCSPDRVALSLSMIGSEQHMIRAGCLLQRM
jgi:hypothetical protein